MKWAVLVKGVGLQGPTGIPYGHQVGLMSLLMIHEAYMPVNFPYVSVTLTKFMSWEGNPERSRTFFGKEFCPRKSQDFAKSRPRNPGIKNSDPVAAWPPCIGTLMVISRLSFVSNDVFQDVLSSTKLSL